MRSGSWLIGVILVAAIAAYKGYGTYQKAEAYPKVGDVIALGGNVYCAKTESDKDDLDHAVIVDDMPRVHQLEKLTYNIQAPSRLVIVDGPALSVHVLDGTDKGITCFPRVEDITRDGDLRVRTK